MSSDWHSVQRYDVIERDSRPTKDDGNVMGDNSTLNKIREIYDALCDRNNKQPRRRVASHRSTSEERATALACGLPCPDERADGGDDDRADGPDPDRVAVAEAAMNKRLDDMWKRSPSASKQAKTWGATAAAEAGQDDDDDDDEDDDPVRKAEDAMNKRLNDAWKGSRNAGR